MRPDRCCPLPAPKWVYTLVNADPVQQKPCDAPGVTLWTQRTEKFTLVSVQIANARGLSHEALGDITQSAYGQIAQVLGASQAYHPVRFWNHIPGIHTDRGGLDRYMAFNVGRYRAFCAWFGGETNFGGSIATASGVGCEGDNLIIHALGTNCPGIPVANPRQVQPFHYSKRFGPRPPCFARATVVPEHQFASIGGTASVRGEESMHVGNLPTQLEETFENLSVLMGKCGEVAGRPATLASITDLRVYVPRRADLAAIEAACRRVIPTTEHVEFVPADLCRRDLLVEIEAMWRW